MSRRCAAACCAAAYGLLAATAIAGPLRPDEPVAAADGRMLKVRWPDPSKPTATLIEVPVPAVHARVTASTLVSRPELEFSIGEVQRAPLRMQLLMVRLAGKPPLPVAVISLFDAGDQPHLWIERVAPSGQAGDGGDLELATIEHLYGLALAHDPVARYCLTGYGRVCSRVDDDYPQAELLRELHEARGRALPHARRTGRYLAWQQVSMSTAAANDEADDQVGVRVVRDGRPMAGAKIFFNRSPHSICKATTTPDGLATCRLVDQEADEEAHAQDEKKAAVVAVFPGDVGNGRVLLPTTLVLKSRP